MGKILFSIALYFHMILSGLMGLMFLVAGIGILSNGDSAGIVQIVFSFGGWGLLYYAIQFKRGKIIIDKFWTMTVIFSVICLFLPILTAAFVKLFYGKLSSEEKSFYEAAYHQEVAAKEAAKKAKLKESEVGGDLESDRADQKSAADGSFSLQAYLQPMLEKWSSFSSKEKVIYGLLAFLALSFVVGLTSSDSSGSIRSVNEEDQPEKTTASVLYEYYQVEPTNLYSVKELKKEAACVKEDKCRQWDAKEGFKYIANHLHANNYSAAYHPLSLLNKELFRGLPKTESFPSWQRGNWYESYKHGTGFIREYLNYLLSAETGFWTEEVESAKLKELYAKYDDYETKRSLTHYDEADVERLYRFYQAAKELESIVLAEYKREQAEFAKQAKSAVEEIKREKDPEKAYQAAVTLLKKYPYYYDLPKLIRFKRIKSKYGPFLKAKVTKDLTEYSKQGQVVEFDKSLKEFLTKSEPAIVDERLAKRIVSLRVTANNNGFLNSQEEKLKAFEETYQPVEYLKAIKTLEKKYPFSDKLQLAYANYYIENNQDLVNEAKAMVRIKKKNKPADYDRLLTKMKELAEVSGQQVAIVTLKDQVQQAYYYTRVTMMNAAEYNPDQFNKLYKEVNKTHSDDKELQKMYVDYFKNGNKELLADAENLIKKYKTAKPEAYPAVIKDMKELSELTNNTAYFSERLEKLEFLNDIFSLPDDEKYKAIELQSCRCYYPSRKSRTATCVVQAENFSEKNFKDTTIRVVHKDKKGRPIDLAYIQSVQTVKRFSKAKLTIRNATFPKETNEQECSITTSGVI